jgi:hypothetical protein
MPLQGMVLICVCTMQGLEKSPQQLLDDLEANPKQNRMRIKAYIGSLKSRAAARSQLSALRSFCAFHESDLRLNGAKVRVPRTRKKPYLAWDEAEKIIAETKEPYRGVFKFLMRCGLGLDEFAEIQGSAEIQGEITKQLNDKSRPYVRIGLRPRKANTDTFYTLVQKAFVPQFPVLTRDYGSRGNQPVTGLELGDELVEGEKTCRSRRSNWPGTTHAQVHIQEPMRVTRSLRRSSGVLHGTWNTRKLRLLTRDEERVLRGWRTIEAVERLNIGHKP